MSKFQQELAVLLIVDSILFAEFKTTALGVIHLIFMVSFVMLMWAREKK
ncbi:hypothetical protein [Acinetobacter colistiniresistens]|nr:hypothetical protein [Acinetobacter colistiniresistens]